MRSKILTTPLLQLILIWFFAIPVVSGVSVFDLPWDLPAPAEKTLDSSDDQQHWLSAGDLPLLFHALDEIAAGRLAATRIFEYTASQPHPGPIAPDHPSRGPPHAFS